MNILDKIRSIISGSSTEYVLKDNSGTQSSHKHTKDQITDLPAIPEAANNGTLTIQKNGTNVAQFCADSASDVTANISVPTALSELSTDTTHRVVTDIEKSTWNNKAPTNHASTDTSYGVGDATNYGHVKVDSELSDSSINPVQNKVIKTYVDNKSWFKNNTVLSAIQNSNAYYQCVSASTNDFSCIIKLYDVTEFFDGTIVNQNERSVFFGDMSLIRDGGNAGCKYARVCAMIGYNNGAGNTIVQSNDENCQINLLKEEFDYLTPSVTKASGAYIIENGTAVFNTTYSNARAHVYDIRDNSGKQVAITSGIYANTYGTDVKCYIFVDDDFTVYSYASSDKFSGWVDIPIGATKLIVHIRNSYTAYPPVGPKLETSRYFLVARPMAGWPAGMIEYFGRFYTRTADGTVAGKTVHARPLLLKYVQNHYSQNSSILPAGYSVVRECSYVGRVSNANSADKLATPRSIQTDLGSTTAASFDGSANVTPGVTGTLPIANGGTGATTAANARTNLDVYSKSESDDFRNLVCGTPGYASDSLAEPDLYIQKLAIGGMGVHNKGITLKAYTFVGNDEANAILVFDSTALTGTDKDYFEKGIKRTYFTTNFGESIKFVWTGDTNHYFRALGLYINSHAGSGVDNDHQINARFEIGGSSYETFGMSSWGSYFTFVFHGSQISANIYLVPAKPTNKMTFSGARSLTTYGESDKVLNGTSLYTYALNASRNLKVNLASESAQSFDGSANAENIGVTGTLTIANGGTGATTADVARTNLDVYSKDEVNTALSTAIDSEATTRANADTELGGRIDSEESGRQQADRDLQSQIDAISSKSDVVDVVASYSELLVYDTSTIFDNDVIKVLEDETQDFAESYYRWNATTKIWDYIGSQGPFVTPAEMQSALNGKVDKVNGKGLSTNDYTDDEKNKLAGIARGAEVNVQADWSVTDSNSDAFIKNKPTIPDFNGKLNVDGTNATSAGMSTAINKLAEGSEDFKDTDYIIGSNHSGGITDTSTFVRRTFSALFNRIKAKLDGVYAALSHTHTKSQITDFPTALSGFTDDLHSKLLYGEFLTASVSEGYWCKFLSLDDTSSGYNSFPVKIDVMGRERVMYTCMFRLNHNSASSVSRAEYFSVGGTSQANQEDLIGYVKTDRHYDFYFLNKRSGSLRYKVTTTNGSFYNLFTHPSVSTVVQQTAAPTGIVYFTNMFSTLAYKDGTNATGTWDIDISKNAATSTQSGKLSIKEIGTTNINLDDCTANDGCVHYYAWSNSNRSKVLNKPTDAVYTVEVFVQGAGSTGNYVVQKAYRRGSDEIYVRRLSDRDPYWSSWRRLSYIDETVTNATYATKIGSSSGTQQIGGETIPVYVDSNGEIKRCTATGIAVDSATRAECDANGISISEHYKRKDSYADNFTTSQLIKVSSSNTAAMLYLRNTLSGVEFGISSNGNILLRETTADGSSPRSIIYQSGGHGGSFTFQGDVTGNAATASALSIPSNIGNNTTPIYYDSRTGQFAVCTPSSMSVGSASTATTATTAQKLQVNSAVGGPLRPCYITSNGVPAACDVEFAFYD